MHLRVLHLVLFSHDNNESYDDMYALTSPYYKKFNPDVETYYYCFSDTIPSKYELKDDILAISGVETFLPGILDKTVLAYEYFKDRLQDFHYVVRSNISTVIDWSLLIPRIQKNRFEYGSGFVWTLDTIDPERGICDSTWFGTRFASGSSIIFEPHVVGFLLKNKEMLRRDIIDDVAIGIFIREHCPHIKGIKSFEHAFLFVDYYLYKKPNETLESIVRSREYIFYRNRQQNRKINVEHIKIIVDTLQQV
jgi:hypothetical protein